MTRRGRWSEEQLRREFQQLGLPPGDPTFHFDRDRWAARPQLRRRQVPRGSRLWPAAAVAAAVAALIVGHLTAHVVKSPAAPTASPHVAVAVRRIALGARPNPTVVGQTLRIAGTAYGTHGRPAAHTHLELRGLPGYTSGRTVITNALGQFALTAQWTTPGSYTVTAQQGSAHTTMTVVVQAPSTAGQTPPFAGTQVKFYRGVSTPAAVPAGYAGTNLAAAFSPSVYHRVEGFSGTLAGHPFVVDIYSGYPSGLFVGVSYNHQPVLFAAGPAPVFDILNFTGDWMVLGSPSAGAYEAINLTNGHTLTQASQVVPLKGYEGLAPPTNILGLPGIQQSAAVPYGS